MANGWPPGATIKSPSGYLTRGCVQRVLPLPDHDFPTSLDFNPAGTLLLAALRNNYVKGGNGTLCVWDTGAGTLKKTIAAEDQGIIERAVFSPDGAHVASCSEARNVVLRSTSDWSEEKRLRGNDIAPSGLVLPIDVAFSPDGMKLAWLSMVLIGNGPSNWVNSGRMTVWDIPGGTRDTFETGDNFTARHLQFSPDGKWLGIDGINANISQHNRAQTILWNVATAEEERRLLWPAVIDWCRVSAVTADSSTLLGTTRDGLVAWHLPDGKAQLLDAAAVPLAPDYQMTRKGTLRVINTNDFNDIFPPACCSPTRKSCC